MATRQAYYLPDFPVPRRRRSSRRRRSVTFIVAILAAFAFAGIWKVVTTPRFDAAGAATNPLGGWNREGSSAGHLAPSASGRNSDNDLAIRATTESEQTTRIEAVTSLGNRKLLAQVALSSSDPRVSAIAVKRLCDGLRLLEAVDETSGQRFAPPDGQPDICDSIARLAVEGRNNADREAAQQALREWAFLYSKNRVKRHGELSPYRRRADREFIEILLRAGSLPPVSLALADAAEPALARRDFDLAAELLRTAIAKNENDYGADYDPRDFKDRTVESLEHGTKQVAEMLADRPQMSAFIGPRDELYQWAVKMYSETLDGSKIYWSPEEIASIGSYRPAAQHRPPYPGRPGVIRINPVERGTNSAQAFERLWCCAVFELHNIESARAFSRLDRLARLGTIDEDDYVKGVFLVELVALQRTRRFYVDVYLPHAKNHRLPTNSADWYCGYGEWETPDVQFSLYKDKDSYPWAPYMRSFQHLRDEGAAAATNLR